MKKTTEKLTFAKLPATYDGLAKLHMPRPIRDEVAYDNTVEMIDALAGHDLNAEQEDYLMILSDQVEAYEKETLPEEPKPSGLDMLKYMMEEHDMTGDDLAKVLGVDRSVAYRILKGERSLTAAHLKALSVRFGLPADTFLD
ncbi:putative transcription regulator containing HTH domain [Opitutaceae bacterium TAV1]|nr:putative transcription regulator containing HTH domain [Opitutaceae bacterium TAV1]